MGMALIVMAFEDGPEFRRMVRAVGDAVEFPGDDPRVLVEVMARTFGVEAGCFVASGHVAQAVQGLALLPPDIHLATAARAEIPAREEGWPLRAG